MNSERLKTKKRSGAKNREKRYFNFRLFSSFIKSSGGILIILSAALIGLAQTGQYTDNTRDQTLRGSGRVNASSLGMEFDLPLGAYPGRGINVPISLSYSSKVWRIEYSGTNPTNSGGCYSKNNPVYAEKSAAGWTTSLGVPYIEYTGSKNIYDQSGGGFDFDGQIACDPTNTSSPQLYYIRRLMLHMPSGETHELRASDSAGGYGPWDGIFYAVDSSNIVYKQDSPNGIFKVLMPDGSRYDLDPGAGEGDRYANKFTDRNGNYTTYHAPNGTYPNGYWTDTLGRIIPVPINPVAPSAPTVEGSPQIYAMSGINGTNVNYKFHWKRLNGGTQTESALTDITAQPLKYSTDAYFSGNSSGNLYYYRTDPNTYLFKSDVGASIVVGYNARFNPTVLTKIELPGGESYRFSYNEYGEIERIYYPTGGEERLEYGEVDTVSELMMPFDQANRGVKNRKVFQTAGGATPYQWTYETDKSSNQIIVRTINPDGTKRERFLHLGYDTGWGFGNVLAGMAYRELGYSDTGRLVTEKLTAWTKSGGERHPRVDYEETIIYDDTGAGVSSTNKYEYAGNPGLKETPVLMNKTTQYAYIAKTGSSQNRAYGNPPDPNPTPLPTPPTSTLSPVRITESTYLINDPSVTQTTKDQYYNLTNLSLGLKNMIGLTTSSVVKNGAGTIVSRSEMRYDDTGYSPNVGRGNPTTARVWDSTKGAWNNQNAYIETKARFDTYGNQYEAIDAKGDSTMTTFDGTYQAFPVQVTTVAPGNGTNGSGSAFVTTATYDTVTGLPLSTTDANGQTTTIEYDAETLRPKKVIPPTGAGISETIYNDQPNNYWVKNRTQIDANNWAESITYFDGLGRAYKAEQVDAQGNIFVEKEFDADGRVLRVTNPYRSGEVKRWTTNYYDDASRVVEVELPDGAKVKTDYGISTTAGMIGTTKQITDQAGKKRKGINDALGRMIRVIEDPAGQNLNTDYVFDTLGNLRKTIQGEQSRYFMHDSLGRLLYAKQPEQEANAAFAATDAVTNNSNWSVKYEYDDNGNITKTTDARGVYVQGTYDKFNRLILRDYSDSTPDVSFYYDGTGLGAVPAYSKGQTTKVSSSVSETRYKSFDNLGRLLTHEQRTTAGQRAGTENPYTTAYSYNISGALLTETYPSGRVVRNNYNTDGELESVWGQKANQQTAKVYLNQISYNSSGAVEKARLGNGRWETAQYNERLQVTQIGLGHSATDKSLLKIDYDYGTNTQNNGSLRQQKVGFTGMANELTQDYSYDDLNRLKSATETVSSATSWQQTFNYDRFGNRTFDAANTTTMIASKATNPIIQSADNQFKKDQDNDSINDYDYDANGNLKLDADNQRYVFDAENRIKEFFKSNNSTTNNPNATYEYDGEGKRVRKINDGVETIFVYNAGGTLVAEYSTELNPTPQVSYLTSDHLGSPRIITDGGGAVISRHDYMAFGDEVTQKLGNVGGRTTAQGYGEDDDVRKQYTSYERDNEMDLDFAQARYYNFNHGRFTSVDPLMASASTDNPQTLNRYIYVGNNPLNITDPLGLSWYYSSAADGYKWFGDDETVEDGYVSVVGTEGNDARGVGSFVYQNGRDGGWVRLNPGGNNFQNFDTREAATGDFSRLYNCDFCQALVNSIAEESATKGKVVGGLALGAVVVGTGAGVVMAAGGAAAGTGITTLGLTETATGVGTTVATAAAANPQATSQVASAGIQNVNQLLNSMQNVVQKSSKMQGEIQGNAQQIFNNITQGGTALQNNVVRLADGRVVTLYNSSTNGVATIQVMSGIKVVVRITP